MFAKECGHFHLRILDAFVCLPATLVLSFLELLSFFFFFFHSLTNGLPCRGLCKWEILCHS